MCRCIHMKHASNGSDVTVIAFCDKHRPQSRGTHWHRTSLYHAHVRRLVTGAGR